MIKATNESWFSWRRVLSYQSLFNSPELLVFEEVPPWLQDNAFIRTCYRPPNRSACYYLRSVFKLHNETINIWTHLWGCAYYLNLIYCLLDPSSPRHREMTDLKPLLLLYTGGATAFLASALYHTFSAYSESMRGALVKVDYIGIVIFITCSFITWVHYAFYDTPVQSIYVYSIVFGGLIMAVLSQVETFNEPDARTHRTLMFVFFGLAGILPAFHIFFQSWGRERTYMMVESLLEVSSIYLIGALIYALRIPERLFPGTFDVFGHSHQIFHSLAVAASLVHEMGILQLAIYDARERQQQVNLWRKYIIR